MFSYPSSGIGYVSNMQNKPSAIFNFFKRKRSGVVGAIPKREAHIAIGKELETEVRIWYWSCGEVKHFAQGLLRERSKLLSQILLTMRNENSSEFAKTFCQQNRLAAYKNVKVLPLLLT